ncbi:hypothetical protein FB45DRAFT_938735 [Roridomyces roridus]|uniref:F-box domain-containing protein n=1 Tax=Roridomyces roridus TaxID=1738132 RepID=A0AAD7B843_9AGAR|nr:hypothetical protein FB45DRAFT_938735 [Roridomyces roridus]
MAISLIHLLPVELVLIVLRGSSLANILSLSRTCRYLRSICLTNRTVWLSASDAYKLSLPLGETLKTTPLASLLRNSARSASIESKWRSTPLPEPGAAATPTHIRSSELTHLYDLPAYAFWSPRKYGVPSLLGHAPPTYMNVLPGGRSFLLGSSAHLGVYDLIDGEYGVQLEVPYASGAGREPWPGRGVPEIDWYSGNNGVQTKIVVLSMAFDEEREARSYLSAFTVEYTRSTRIPSVKRTHLCQLPFHATHVFVQGSRVVARSSNTVGVMNLDSGHRALWALPDIDCEITCTAMHEDHPDSVFLVVSSPTAGRSLQAIDILPLSDNIEVLDWPQVSFTRRMIHPALLAPISKFPTSSLGESIEFSADGEELRLRDTALVDPHTLGVSTALVNLGPSSGLPSEIHKEASRFRVIAQNLASTSVHVERSAHGGRQVLARQLDEKGGLVILCPGSDERLLEISVPASMAGLNTKSMVFEVYGILLVFVRGRICVVRY